MDSPLLLIQCLVIAGCIRPDGTFSTPFRGFLKSLIITDFSTLFVNSSSFSERFPFLPPTITTYTYDSIESLVFLLKKSASDIAVLADLQSRSFPAFHILPFGGTKIKFDRIGSFIPFNLMKPFTDAMNMNLLKRFYVQAFGMLRTGHCSSCKQIRRNESTPIRGSSTENMFTAIHACHKCMGLCENSTSRGVVHSFDYLVELVVSVYANLFAQNNYLAPVNLLLEFIELVIPRTSPDSPHTIGTIENSRDAAREYARARNILWVPDKVPHIYCVFVDPSTGESMTKWVSIWKLIHLNPEHESKFRQLLKYCVPVTEPVPPTPKRSWAEIVGN